MSVVSERANIRSGTTTDWASGPILGDGEVGIDTTKKIFKVGDGTTSFASLAVGGGAQVKAVGNTTLVAGTKAVTIAGLAAGDIAVATHRTLGTVTAPKPLIAVASTNTLTITSSDNTDVSVINYVVYAA